MHPFANDISYFLTLASPSPAQSRISAHTGWLTALDGKLGQIDSRVPSKATWKKIGQEMRREHEGCTYTAVEARSRWEKLYGLKGVILGGACISFCSPLYIIESIEHLTESSRPFTSPETSVATSPSADPLSP